MSFWILREILRDTGVPFDWHTSEYRVVDCEENTKATDWESYEVSDEE